MTKIYVVGFCTEDDFLALQDDHGFSTMGDYAMGMTCAAGLDRQQVIDRAQRYLIAELIDCEYGEDYTIEERKAAMEALVFLSNAQDASFIGAYLTADSNDPIAVLAVREFDDE